MQTLIQGLKTNYSYLVQEVKIELEVWTKIFLWRNKCTTRATKQFVSDEYPFRKPKLPEVFRLDCGEKQEIYFLWINVTSNFCDMGKLIYFVPTVHFKIPCKDYENRKRHFIRSFIFAFTVFWMPLNNIVFCERSCMDRVRL